MPRVDIWDVEDHAETPLFIGYKRGLEEGYEIGRLLGEGGFGSVRIVRRKGGTGAEFACKSICKRLDVPNLPPIKQQQHLENIEREVLILRKLRGTLNVVHLEGVFEDDTHVHIVMEFCRGGELFHRLGKRHYSERTVASYMRAVLRTLAQCHSHRVLHRDVKPGNFMLLTEAEDAPLKAIDFGLAVFFDPAKLPLTDLGLEGTPWYMAPEVLSSAVEPASDVWAAGVMAYQLLSGQFPFDDWQHPEAPALSLVWRSILSEEPSFRRTAWQDITPAAKDFCKALLNKDPRARPSARDALAHPWLQKGNAKQRLQGTQLTQVIQRLQRHNQQNVFRKTVLDMMANELLSRHMAAVKEAEQAAADEEAAAAAGTPVGPGPAAAADTPVSPAAAAAGQTGWYDEAAAATPPHLQHSKSCAASQHAASGGPDGAAAAAGAQQQQQQLPAGLLRSASSGPTSPGKPVYLEGSVHRQQQLLRLVPPKRAHNSLELSPAEALAKAPRTSTLHPGAPAAGCSSPGGPSSRLEGTWHGPATGGGRVLLDAAALEGSVHRRGIGSVKGAASALEALRRARERKGLTDSLGPAGAADNVPQQQQQQQQQPLGAGSAAAAAPAPASPLPGAADSSYRGPVRNASSASLWDLQFMANRLALEGSAHGNAWAHRLMQAAGRSPGSASLLQAASVIAQQQQQQQSQPAPDQPAAAAAAAAGGGPAADAALPSPLRSKSINVASLARMEGTWHGPAGAAAAPAGGSPSGSGGLGPGGISAASIQERLAALDRSWHGQTLRSCQSMSDRAGPLQQAERQEFLAFLEAAKRQRQEQRKVARLVLEGSTHGGWQPGAVRKTTATAGHAAGGKGVSSLLENRAFDTDGGSSSGGTPGSSGRGGSAAAAAASTAATTAATQGEADGKQRGFFGKLRKSMKGLLPGGSLNRDAALSAVLNEGTVSSSGTSFGEGGGVKRVDSVNKLARDSYFPGAAEDKETVFELPPDLQQQQQQPEPPGKAHVASQILDMQSPGWQASLESRRRGQGAYAALMAATSIATGEEPPAPAAAGADAAEPAAEPAAAAAASSAAILAVPATPAAAEPPPAEPAAAAPLQPAGSWRPPASDLLVLPSSSKQPPAQQQQQPQQPQPAAAPLRPKTAPKHVGFAESPPVVISPEPLPQPASQQQPQRGHELLVQPVSKQQPQQQTQFAPSSLLPQPGGGSFRQASAGSMLPMPGSSTARAASAASAVPAAAAAATAGPTPAAAAAATPRPATVKHIQHLSSTAAPSDAPAAKVVVAATPAAAPATPGVLAAAVAAAEARAPAAASQLLPVDVQQGQPQQQGQPLPLLGEVAALLEALQYDQRDFLTVEQLQDGLAGLGYRLEPSEVLELARGLGYGVEGVEGVGLSQFAASQLDWEELQVNHRDEWLACLRSTFEAMDADGDGRIKPSDILDSLKQKLPEAEVNAAIEDVLLEAAADEDEGLDFAAFKVLASMPAQDSRAALDQYDARLLAELGGSVSGGDAALHALATVPESGG